MTADLWCIVYRTGGTDNFQWHRSLATTREEGERALEAERLAGRTSSMLVNFRLSMSIGLPEGFGEPNDIPNDWPWVYPDGTPTLRY